jgi:hypothetical protein
MTDAETSAEPIVVDFSVRPGRQQVALTAEEVAAKSALAMERSLATIEQMARKVEGTMRSLGDMRPDGVDVTFGIRFDVEAGAIITKAGIEANLEVKLRWG